MNIFIHVEVAARELRAKLALAILSAQKGNTVFLGNLPSLDSLTESQLLQPGIFHNKGVVPNREGVALRHKSLRRKNFRITAQDEESGLLSESYDAFSNSRFSKSTLGDVEYLFCWGDHDFEALSAKFPQYSNKLRRTGSPRVDFWFPNVEFPGNGLPRGIKRKKYILFSSNFSVNSVTPHWFHFRARIRDGEAEKDPEFSKHFFESRAEQYMLIRKLSETLPKVAERYPEHKLLVRPHPTEDQAAWAYMLEECPEILVTKTGQIEELVHSASAVIHNGCTTGIEGIFGNVPVIAYRPQANLQYEREIPNMLSAEAFSEVELFKLLDDALSEPWKFDQHYSEQRQRHYIQQRFCNEGNFSASRAIANAWQELEQCFQEQKKIPTIRIRALMKIKKWRHELSSRVVRRSIRYGRVEKFPSLSDQTIQKEVGWLSKRLDAPLPRVTRLDDRLLMIRHPKSC